MKVWIAEVNTDAGDHYLYVFQKKPSLHNLLKRVWKEEGRIESLKYYKETCGVSFRKIEVEK